jgi:hypothetical protein
LGAIKDPAVRDKILAMLATPEGGGAAPPAEPPKQS